MADMDDVPPLEDMSELLTQVNAIRESRTSEVQPKEPATLKKDKVVKNDVEVSGKSKPAPKQVVPENSKPQSSTFAGMKKGFLFGGGGASKKKETPVKTKVKDSTVEEIPYLKPKESKDAGLKLPELSGQDHAQAFLQNKDTWLTDDLLKNVEKNEKLVKRLADPIFMSALTEFQTNPQAASQKYQNNPEMQEFFKDFCGLMGDHFSKLGASQGTSNPTPQPKSQPTVQTKSNNGGADLKVHKSTNPKQATSQDEERMAQILADPEIKDILLDPRIQKLFEVLRTNPERGQRFVQEADPALQQRLRKLVEAGLLQFQR